MQFKKHFRDNLEKWKILTSFFDDDDGGDMGTPTIFGLKWL